MNQISGVIIGLILGLGLGFLIGKLISAKNSAESGAATLALNEALTQERERAKLLGEQLTALRSEESEKVRLDEGLKAVTTSMKTLAEQAQAAEIKRAEAESAMKAQIEHMKLGNETLLRETTKLAGALSNSQTRGKYGEAQLEMILENSGLKENIHYFKQDYQVRDNVGSKEISKPDIRIAIPGGSEIYIDSKFPFDRFLEAVVEKDATLRADLMGQHAKDLMGHVNALAKRGYQEGSNSPDYVVLFAPFESILSEALEVDPLLLHKAFEKGVTIATPTTMMALLRTVAYVFSQSDMAHNASAIKELAGELIKRIGKVHGKIATLGDRIKSTERAFNELIASSEENMLRPAKKMVALGVPSKGKLTATTPIDDEVRQLKAKSGNELDLSIDDGDEDESFDELEENE
jgi:DNA recombination protein RmuC